MPRKGFDSYDKEALKEMARKGGKSAHEQGVAHEWSSEEAREAGRKGGAATAAKRKAAKERREDIAQAFENEGSMEVAAQLRAVR